jgi:hypothetical protein
MQMPTEELRHRVADQEATETSCEHSLELIQEALARELKNEEFSATDMPAVYAWSSLVSFAVGRTYAPYSPMRFPGFSRGVARTVTALVELLLRAMQEIIRHLGERTEFGVSVGLPWGVSVSVSYDVALRDVQQLIDKP